MSLTALFPQAMLAGWHFRSPPSEVTWPAIDDPIWPADMPLALRAAPESWRVEYWWHNYDFNRTQAPRGAAVAALVALLAGAVAWWGASVPALSETFIVVAAFGALAAFYLCREWRSWDARDWSQFVVMWPHVRVRQWTDQQWQDRPRWWPRILWFSMHRRTFRYVSNALILPFALVIALAKIALLLTAIGIFFVGLFHVLSWVV